MRRAAICLPSLVALGGATGVARAQEAARSSRWIGEPVPGARGGAQLGALVGVPLGGLLGARTECRRSAVPGCFLGGALYGAAVGGFAGSVLGASTGAAAESHCRAGASLARAIAGAALWSAPAAAYFAFLPHQWRRHEISFVVVATLPLLQSEGAARAASGACT